MPPRPAGAAQTRRSWPKPQPVRRGYRAGPGASRPLPRAGGMPAVRLHASLGAAEAFLFGDRALADRRGRMGKFAVELGKGDAGILLLVGVAEGNSELQQFFRRLA